MASASFALPPISPPYSHRIRQPLRVSAGYATAERGGVAVASSSFYDVLGIRTGATCQEIKSAYRKLARVLHPDVGASSSADEFMRVHAAYSTLSDPDKRVAYDSSLFRRPIAAAAVSSPGGYSDANRRRRTWETDQCW